MYSFNFPNMLNNTTSRLLEGKKAVKSNLLLLLSSERETLFGDPYFGSELKKVMFEQSTSLIVDLLIDEIYTAIISFIPQIFIERKNIEVYTEDRDVYISISYIYKLDNTSDLYVINLTNSEGL
jgi:phage baseplate assembly protein W